MRLLSVAIVSLLALESAYAQKPDFTWPAVGEAIPDARTAIMISLAIFRGQIKRDIGDDKDLAKLLEAYRYRTSDTKRDLKGDAWFVHLAPEEQVRFDKACASTCVGGELYTMSLSAHDGRVLEFYVPQ